MANRAQIQRLSRSVDRIALAIQPTAVTYVPIYQGETEAEALSMRRRESGTELHPGRIVLSKARTGDRREARVVSGLHQLYCLGPADFRCLLACIDGKTCGIPMTCEI